MAKKPQKKEQNKEVDASGERIAPSEDPKHVWDNNPHHPDSGK